MNFFEQNIAFNRKGNVGLVSGLGLSWNNYRFADNVMLKNENNKLVGYYMDGVSVKKSKLVNTFLTLPLFMEFQIGRKAIKGKCIWPLALSADGDSAATPKCITLSKIKCSGFSTQ